jgi:hypothetical protein
MDQGRLQDDMPSWMVDLAISSIGYDWLTLTSMGLPEAIEA